MKPAVRYALPLALAGALLAGCGSGESDDDGQVEAGHTHAPGQGHTSMAVGDGTRVSEVGYSLAGLQVRVDGFLHTVPVELTVARSA